MSDHHDVVYPHRPDQHDFASCERCIAAAATSRVRSDSLDDLRRCMSGLSVTAFGRIYLDRCHHPTAAECDAAMRRALHDLTDQDQADV